MKKSNTKWLRKVFAHNFIYYHNIYFIIIWNINGRSILSAKAIIKISW